VLGKYIIDLDDATPGDWMRTRYAESIIREKGARVLTLHIASLDHIEHETGPQSAKGFAALEEIDKMVAVLEKAIRSVARNAAVCVVSDHGMARVDHELNLSVAFVKAGLITPAERKTARNPAILSWKAQPWSSSGSAAIVLNEANDQETLTNVKRLLTGLAADPANGIAAILDRKAIDEMGGSPRAAFWVDMRPGFSIGSALTGPLTREIPVRGTHGYSPIHPEMRASFFIAGPGIRNGFDLGEIEVRSFAPTLAKLLGLSFPTADLQPLAVFAK
jgi:predicted AlkP superfamily pyrophosphatase or phosphodiesterase